MFPRSAVKTVAEISNPDTSPAGRTRLLRIAQGGSGRDDLASPAAGLFPLNFEQIKGVERMKNNTHC
jgi:hypothetical protein